MTFKALVGISLVLALGTPALASHSPSTKGALRPLLVRDLQNRTPGTAFDDTLDRWSRDYGSEAVRPLLDIAGDKKLPEPHRYIAVMGATRLGGTAVTPHLTGLLHDTSWMIRSAALRALAILRDPSTGKAVLGLLKDKALVVRAEAVETIRLLKPPGAAQALVDAALHKDNYHGGKAQWVPVQAIAALREFGAAGAMTQLPRLVPVLDTKGDEALLNETVSTFEYLGHKTLAAGESLDVRAAAWRKEFAKR